MKQPQYASPFLLSDTGAVECVELHAPMQESDIVRERRLTAATQWQHRYCQQAQADQTTLKIPNVSTLNGMRLAVKDLFHMTGLPTSAGNPDWLNSHEQSTSTSPVITRLIAAGATFVGKTQTDELAYSLNGQNTHFGTPVNPAAPDRLPGGSSSGSASAVSLNLADIGLGTDTGGSIRVPASYQGLFGLRPTYHAIPCEDMVALAPQFDTIGWMTRDLSTLRNVAQVLLPAASSAALTPKSAPKSAPKLMLLQALSEQSEQHAQINEFLNRKHQSQHILLAKDNALDPFALQAGESFRILQGYAIWQEHGHWLSQHPRHIADDILTRFNWCRTISAAQVTIAKAQQHRVITALNQVLLQADALILPTTPGRSPLLSSSGHVLAEYRHTLLNLTALAGLAGLPQLHLPLFHIDNSPCGLSLLGKAGSELQLIQIAEQLLE